MIMAQKKKKECKWHAVPFFSTFRLLLYFYFEADFMKGIKREQKDYYGLRTDRYLDYMFSVRRNGLIFKEME